MIRRSGDSQTLVYNRKWNLCRWLGLLCQIPFFGTSAGSFGTFEKPPGPLQVTAKDKGDEAPVGPVAPHNRVEPLPSLLPGMSGVITLLDGWRRRRRTRYELALAGKATEKRRQPLLQSRKLRVCSQIVPHISLTVFSLCVNKIFLYKNE